MIDKCSVLNDLAAESTHRRVDATSEYYANVIDLIVSTRGYFSLVFPINPFVGPIINLDWDEKWRDSTVDEWEVASWLGTGIEWVSGNESRPGKAIVRIYQANRLTKGMLSVADSIFGWSRPKPEDFAAYDSSGKVICFTIAHEELLFELSR